MSLPTKDVDSRTTGDKKYIRRPKLLARERKFFGMRKGSRNLMTLLLFCSFSISLFLRGKFLSCLPFLLSLFQLGFLAKTEAGKTKFAGEEDSYSKTERDPLGQIGKAALPLLTNCKNAGSDRNSKGDTKTNGFSGISFSPAEEKFRVKYSRKI